MSPDEPETLPQEEEFSLWLAACDERLAAGGPVGSPDELGAPAALRERLEREAAWCQLVRRMWSQAARSDLDPTAYRSGIPQVTPAPAGLGRFAIRRELGRGAFGVVYLAYDPRLRRELALKVPRAEVFLTPELRMRFQHEAMAAAGLDHPNIVPVYEAGEEGSVCFIASAYCPGITLAGWLRHRTGSVPYHVAAGLVATLSEAVDHAHRRGVLHRDLKPSNVLLETTSPGTPGGDGSELIPRVTDFGLAKLVDMGSGESDTTPPTLSGVILGTPSYMAPEQAQGLAGGVGAAADIYSLGVILYEMLTGRPPFQEDSALDTLVLVRTQDPLPPSRLRPRLPRDLETICLKCLHKQPQARYPTAQALADDLRRFLAALPIRARPVGRAERLLKWVKRRPAVAALAGGIIFVVLVGLVTSLGLAGWALRERDRASERLAEVQEADRRRLQARFEQLESAVPEAVPALLAALEEDRETLWPRLRALWADETGDPQRRLRAGLALVEDPPVRHRLAGRMVETEDAREMLMMRAVLAPHGTELAAGLWNRVDDPKVHAGVIRALVALAAFDPADPRWARAGPTVVEQLLEANPLVLGLWIQALRPVRAALYGPLSAVFRGKPKLLADRRLVAASVLADYAADRPSELADLACDADVEQFQLLWPVLEKSRKAACDALMVELAKAPPAAETEDERIARARHQAHAAAALMALGEPSPAWTILKHAQRPDGRTALIHSLATHGADPRVLIRRLLEETDDSIRVGLILALGEYNAEQLPREARAALTTKLLAWYRNDPDPGVHGAIDWLLRHGKEGPVDRPIDWDGGKDLEKIDAELAGQPGPAGRRWYVNGRGQTLTTIRGPVAFSMGSPVDETDRVAAETLHRRTIRRSFAMATRLVTVAEWKTFMKAMERANLHITHDYWSNYAPQPSCPILAVSWYDAAMYCRWLSELEGVPGEQMVYPPIAEILKCADGITPLKLPANHLSRTGYRLPTGAELEYACRAGTATRWCFGGAEEFLPRHAWFLGNSQGRSWPVAEKKPNELGLFDIHGNAWTWCLEGVRPYDPAGMDDDEDTRHIDNNNLRNIRGGSFLYEPAILRAAFSENDRPSYPGLTVGFRLARTLIP